MGKKAPNPRVFFDISIGGEPAGKMVMEVSKPLSCGHSVPFFSFTFLSSSLNIVLAVIKSPGLPLLPQYLSFDTVLFSLAFLHLSGNFLTVFRSLNGTSMFLNSSTESFCSNPNKFFVATSTCSFMQMLYPRLRKTFEHFAQVSLWHHLSKPKLWFGMYSKCLPELMWVLWGFPKTTFTSLCIYEVQWNCSQVAKKKIVIHLGFIEYVFYAVQVVVGVWCLLMLVWTYLLVVEFLTAVKNFVVKWICKLAWVSLIIIFSIIQI